MKTGVMSIDLHNQQQEENLKAHKMYYEAYAEYTKAEKRRMKQPTKQELKDRIAELDIKYRNQIEERRKLVRVNYNLREEIQMIERNLDWHIVRGKRATLAAYALLATLAAIVVMEVVL